MRAAVLYEPGSPLEIEELDLAEPREGEIRVRLSAIGVCHSDYHYMRGDLPCPLPIVLGHEGAGEVISVGPGVTRSKPVTGWCSCGVPAAGTVATAPPDGRRCARKGAPPSSVGACSTARVDCGWAAGR